MLDNELDNSEHDDQEPAGPRSGAGSGPVDPVGQVPLTAEQHPSASQGSSASAPPPLSASQDSGGAGGVAAGGAGGVAAGDAGGVAAGDAAASGPPGVGDAAGMTGPPGAGDVPALSWQSAAGNGPSAPVTAPPAFEAPPQAVTGSKAPAATSAQAPSVPVQAAQVPAAQVPAAPVPAATFQPPQVIFQPPAVSPAPATDADDDADHEAETDDETGGSRRRRRRGGRGRAKGADGDASGNGADAAGGASGEAGHAVAGPARGGGRENRSQQAGQSPGEDGAGHAQGEAPRSAGSSRSRRRGAGKDLQGAPEPEGAGTDAVGGGTAKGGPANASADTAEAGSRAGGEKSASATSRGRRARTSRGSESSDAADEAASAQARGAHEREDSADVEGDGESAATRRRRRRRRRGGAGDGEAAVVTVADDPPNTVVHVREPRAAAAADWDEVQSVKGSTRLEAKKQRRREGRDSGRRRPPVLTESEFLARREAVQRVMLIRQKDERIQIAVLEDGVLVEHYVDRASHQSMAGNIYLGKVQNVLPSMEAAFVDIGKGRNAVLYAGEINFDASGLEGQPKRIEMVLKSGQSVLVQVTKDPVGHKGARLTNQVSLPGRYLVYVPGASMTGISRKLPVTERTRLKQILKKVTPENAGVIVRTAAEGTGEEELSRDVARLAAQWENIERKAQSASPPELLYSEPDLTIRVVRDIFNEDFGELVVAGDEGWDTVNEYVRYVAPHLADRLRRWQDDDDLFASYRIDEQLSKALERKVWLPSGGSLVIDRTEAMTVIDVNTGKFTGQGGNLEETVTRNNLEAAEEIVRQLRLRDIGGIIVIDFIDMVLESNRELVLRRLLECLARDRTKHQVAEVTSLGLVQMTRKRVGSGLLEAFSQTCECCNGRGLIVSMDLLEPSSHGGKRAPATTQGGRGSGKGDAKGQGKGRDGGKGRDAAAVAASPAATDSDTGNSDAGKSGAANNGAVPAGSPNAGAPNAGAPNAGAPNAGAGSPAGESVAVGPAVGEASPPDGSADSKVRPQEKASGGRRRRRKSAAPAASSVQGAEVQGAEGQRLEGQRAEGQRAEGQRADIQSADATTVLP
jgi:ribonuclease E